MAIGILALQGDFLEHRRMLESLGATCVELRSKEDAIAPLDGLVLPGGESSVQGKLLRDLGMFESLQGKIRAGIPVLATCAGLILLAENIHNDRRTGFRTLPVSVRRNAYGRQLGSFSTVQPFQGIGKVEMRFIRAPSIESTGQGVEVLALAREHPVAVRYGNQIAMAFHPELGTDARIHEEFRRIVENNHSPGISE